MLNIGAPSTSITFHLLLFSFDSGVIVQEPPCFPCRGSCCFQIACRLELKLHGKKHMEHLYLESLEPVGTNPLAWLLEDTEEWKMLGLFPVEAPCFSSLLCKGKDLDPIYISKKLHGDVSSQETCHLFSDGGKKLHKC